MMVTYEFYSTEYYGDIIPESAFVRIETRAEDELNVLTQGRLKELISYPQEVKKAVCSLAETLYRIEEESRKPGNEGENGKMIKSVSSGGESVTYEIRKSGFEAAVTDKKARNLLCLDAVRQYLSGTGLLYWGV